MEVLLSEGELVGGGEEEASFLGGADLVRPRLVGGEFGILLFEELEVGAGRGGDLVVVHELFFALLLGDEHGAEVAPVALERGGDVVVERGRLLRVLSHVVSLLPIPSLIHGLLRLYLFVLLLGGVVGCLLGLVRVRLARAVAPLLGGQRDEPSAVGALPQFQHVIFIPRPAGKLGSSRRARAGLWRARGRDASRGPHGDRSDDGRVHLARVYRLSVGVWVPHVVQIRGRVGQTRVPTWIRRTEISPYCIPHGCSIREEFMVNGIDTSTVLQL